jgi:hypothetical protein
MLISLASRHLVDQAENKCLDYSFFCSNTVVIVMIVHSPKKKMKSNASGRRPLQTVMTIKITVSCSDIFTFRPVYEKINR